MRKNKMVSVDRKCLICECAGGGDMEGVLRGGVCVPDGAR